MNLLFTFSSPIEQHNGPLSFDDLGSLCKVGGGAGTAQRGFPPLVYAGKFLLHGPRAQERRRRPPYRDLQQKSLRPASQGFREALLLGDVLSRGQHSRRQETCCSRAAAFPSR